jgi:glutaredoxin-related protein
MASTFSPLLKIELIGIGDQNNTWGSTNNSNLGTLIEEAIAGTATIDVTAGSVTLTNYDGATDQARCSVLRVIGTPGVSRNIIAPAHSKIFVVANGSNAAVVLKSSTSTGLTIPAGEIYLAYFDTTLNDFEYVGKAASATNISNTLVLRDSIGSFGANIIAANGFVGPLLGNVTGNLVASAPTAPTATAGTSTTQVATTAFVTTALQLLYPVGAIYSSTVGTNPGTTFGFGTWVAFGAGRVAIGNGGGFTAGTTGGSADAVLPSHSHNFTGNALPGHSHGYDRAGSLAPQSGSATNCLTNPATTHPQTDVVSAGTPSGSIDFQGVSATNANLQPYIVVYMWNRTA